MGLLVVFEERNEVGRRAPRDRPRRSRPDQSLPLHHRNLAAATTNLLLPLRPNITGTTSCCLPDAPLPPRTQYLLARCCLSGPIQPTIFRVVKSRKLPEFPTSRVVLIYISDYNKFALQFPVFISISRFC